MKESITIFGNDLIGDAIMQSPTIANIKAFAPNIEINYRCPKGSVSELIHSRNKHISNIYHADSQEAGDVIIHCTKAMEIGIQNHISMLEGFSAILDLPLLSKDLVYDPTTEDQAGAKKIFEDELESKPFVLIARHSASCTSHNESVGFKPNKCFSNIYWLEVAKELKAMGIEPVAIGSTKDLEEERFKDWPYKTLYGYPLEHIAALCEFSNGVLSVDTGIRFLASVVGANFLVISCAVPTWLVSTKPIVPGQRGIELNMPVASIDLEFIKKLLKPLFGGSNV